MDDAEKAAGYTESNNQDCVSRVVTKLRRRTGPSALVCEDCEREIPEECRKMSKGCTRCTSCQTRFDREGKS